MGRVLPSLTTRSGIVGVADAIGANKDQQLRNALRRAAFQKAEERKTPEGMLKFIGQAAQTAGQVTGAVKGIGGLIGSLPLSDAMRNAAAAKASKDMVLPQARKTIERVAGATGLGEGAPVTPETARMIQQASLEGPQGRVAAGALGAEAAQDIAMRAERGMEGEGLSAAAESDLEQRIEQERQNIVPGRQGYTSEMLMEAADRELKAGARDINDAMEIAKDKLAERAAEESMATDTAQRAAEQEAVGTTLGEVSPVTRADEGEVQIDMFVESLGDTPLDRQEKLLSLAQGALTAEDQANILRAVDRMDIAPGPNVSDLFDPKGAYKRKLRAAMPSLGRLEQERLRGERARLKAGVQVRGQDLRAVASKDTTAQKREKTASQEGIAKQKEARYAREITEKIRQFNLTHNYKWATLGSREKIEEERNKVRVRIAKIKSATRGRGRARKNPLIAALGAGIKESKEREDQLLKASKSTNRAVKQYKIAVAKEKSRIKERVQDIRKYFGFADTLDKDGKTVLLVQLEQSLKDAKEKKSNLEVVGAQLRQATQKYKKLRVRLNQNPNDPDLLNDYAAVENEYVGLLSTYQDLMMGVAEVD